MNAAENFSLSFSSPLIDASMTLNKQLSLQYLSTSLEVAPSAPNQWFEGSSAVDKIYVSYTFYKI